MYTNYYREGKAFFLCDPILVLCVWASCDSELFDSTNAECYTDHLFWVLDGFVHTIDQEMVIYKKIWIG